MPTTVTRTIQPAGGDYTSLAAWEAAENGDLVAADEIRRALCSDLGAPDGPVTIAGGTADATRYLVVESADNHGGVWNTSAYRIAVSFFGNGIQIEQNYTQILGVQVQTANLSGFGGTGISLGFDGTAGTFVHGGVIERCIVRSSGSYAASGSASFGISEAVGPNVVANCIVYDFTSTTNPSIGINLQNAGSVAYNNTVYGCDYGINHNGGSVKNNVVQVCSIACYNATATVAATNISDDGTHASGKTATVTFVSTTPGSEDFHLALSDTEAIGYGTDLSADATYSITVDIDNVARTAPYDAGADQTAAAAGAVLEATLSGGATLTAELTTGIALAASLAGAASLSAELTTAIALAASLSSTSSVSANLTTSIDLAVSLTATATLEASLTATAPIAADLSSESTLTAELTTATQLAASLASAASLTATLSTQIQLAASLSASASLIATLSVIHATITLLGDVRDLTPRVLVWDVTPDVRAGDLDTAVAVSDRTPSILVTEVQ